MAAIQIRVTDLRFRRIMALQILKIQLVHFRTEHYASIRIRFNFANIYSRVTPQFFSSRHRETPTLRALNFGNSYLLFSRTLKLDIVCMHIKLQSMPDCRLRNLF